MSLWQSVLLGLIQGLTEFLPVSSSGHLVIFQELLGLEEPGVTLEVLLHFGTLFSVLWVFRKDFIKLFEFKKEPAQRNFLLMLIIALIPTAVIGFLLHDHADLLFKSTLLVGLMLLVTGTFLKLLTMIPIGTKGKDHIRTGDALTVGLLQGLAVIPGISRSGSTILGALFRGLDRDTAVRYSFMLSAPVILGATVLELYEMLKIGIESAVLLNYSAGLFMAFLAGIAAIKLFIRLLSKQKFHYFAYYCWTVGIAVIIYSLFSH